MMVVTPTRGENPVTVTGRGAVPVSDSEVAVDDNAVWVHGHVLSQLGVLRDGVGGGGAGGDCMWEGGRGHGY